jgi:pilus assembly protein CpaB
LRDAPQALSGLALPGDYVDVILTQSFDDKPGSTACRAAAETVLRDVRVIAADQSLGEPVKADAKTGAGVAQKPETRVPKTITLEVDEHQAQTLLIAREIGKVQLAARPLADSGVTQIADGRRGAPAWVAGISPMFKELARKPMGTGSALENNVRYPPCPAASGWSQGEAQ